MNFYEIQEPYYALIKAKDEVEATKIYIDEVAGYDEEFEEIRESMERVNPYYAIGKTVLSIDENTGEMVTQKELLRVMDEEKTEVLLIDGSLL